MVNLALDPGVDYGQPFDRDDHDRSCSPEQLAPLLGPGAMQELANASTIAAAEAAAANRWELLQGMLRPASAVAAAAAGVGPGSPTKAAAGGLGGGVGGGRPSTSPSRPRSSARQQLQVYQGGGGRPHTAAGSGRGGNSNFSPGDTGECNQLDGLMVWVGWQPSIVWAYLLSTPFLSECFVVAVAQLSVCLVIIHHPETACPPTNQPTIHPYPP
jgi:hypothetical protein